MRKNFKTILLTILISLFIIPFASALLMPPIISDTLRRIFSGGVPEAYVLKMLITLLVFLVFYWGAGALFKKDRGFGDKKTNMFRWTISLVMALIVGLFTPYSLLETYKTIMLLSIPLLGTAGILLLAHKSAKSKHHISAALLYLFLMTIVSLVIAKSSEFGIREHRLMTGFSFIDMFELILFVAFILMLVQFGKSLGLKRGSGLFGRHDTPDRHYPHTPGSPPTTPEEKREGEIEKAEEGEVETGEKIETKEIKTDIRIFKELEQLKRLVEEWGTTITETNKKGDPGKRNAVFDELKRLRKLTFIKNRLEDLNVKNIYKLERTMGMTNSKGDLVPYKKLITQEHDLNVVFEKFLDYISYRCGYNPKTGKENPMMEPQINDILAAINRAMEIEVKEIRVEKEVLNEENKAAHEIKKAEKAITRPSNSSQVRF